MTEKTLAKAAEDLETLITKRKKLREDFEAEDKKFETIQNKIATFIKSWTGDRIECTSEVIAENEPYLFWKINEPSDANIILMYRNIREIHQGLSKVTETKVKEYKEQLEEMELWMAMELAKRKTNSTSSEHGTAYKKVVVKASVEDMKGIVDWASENNCEEIFTKSVKASFCEEYLEQTRQDEIAKLIGEGVDPAVASKQAVGEYPPFVKIFREEKVVFNKS